MSALEEWDQVFYHIHLHVAIKIHTISYKKTEIREVVWLKRKKSSLPVSSCNEQKVTEIRIHFPSYWN